MHVPNMAKIDSELSEKEGMEAYKPITNPVE
jgi:hypothetical protein